MLCEPANWERKVIAGREGGKEREKGSNDEKSQGFGEDRFPRTVCPLFSSCLFLCYPLPHQSHIGNDTALVGFREQAFGDSIRTAL